MRLAATLCAAAAVFAALPALASCRLDDPPARYLQVDAGSSDASVTKGYVPWHETYVQAQYRERTQHAYYLRAASDSRFGATDPNYEGGTYQQIARNVVAGVFAGYSPTHVQLPATFLGGGVDVRFSHGYGMQAQYVERSYTAQNVGITTVGADRYAGAAHLLVALTGAVVSNAPGTAVSERVGYERYAGCDDLAVTVAAGRDVESTGVGSSVAVYEAYTYDAQNTHWMNARYAWQLGAGWYPLVGAYSRFELRFALRGRF